MSVLLIGASGCIGRRLCQAEADYWFDVRGHEAG